MRSMEGLSLNENLRMRSALGIFLAVVICLVFASIASTTEKGGESQIREIPGTGKIEIGIDSNYIRGKIHTVHIKAGKRWLKPKSSVSIYCTLSENGKEFGTLTFNEDIEEDSGALYAIDIPFSPWILYHGQDIKVRFEVIEVARDDELKEVVSKVSDQTSVTTAFSPQSAVVFTAIRPIIEQIVKLREVENRLIIKAERTFYVPEQEIEGLLPLRYQHYIAFDNTARSKDDVPVYEYIKENCRVEDGYLYDTCTKDIYRGTTYIVFTFELKTRLFQDIAQLKEHDFYIYFEIGEEFAEDGNWDAVTKVGYNLSRSIFEDKGLSQEDREFIMTKYETMAEM